MKSYSIIFRCCWNDGTHESAVSNAIWHIITFQYQNLIKLINYLTCNTTTAWSERTYNWLICLLYEIIQLNQTLSKRLPSVWIMNIIKKKRKRKKKKEIVLLAYCSLQNTWWSWLEKTNQLYSSMRISVSRAPVVIRWKVPFLCNKMILITCSS